MLHYLAMRRHGEVIEELLEEFLKRGESMNDEDIQGDTPASLSLSHNPSMFIHGLKLKLSIISNTTLFQIMRIIEPDNFQFVKRKINDYPEIASEYLLSAAVQITLLIFGRYYNKRELKLISIQNAMLML